MLSLKETIAALKRLNNISEPKNGNSSDDRSLAARSGEEQMKHETGEETAPVTSEKASSTSVTKQATPVTSVKIKPVTVEQFTSVSLEKQKPTVLNGAKSEDGTLEKPAIVSVKQVTPVIVESRLSVIKKSEKGENYLKRPEPGKVC